MTQGSPMGNLVKFSVPLLIGNMAQQLYSTVDSIVVGNYVGDGALAAVGASGPILNLLLVLFMGISMGAATVLMASGLELPPNTRGIVADCGFTTPWDIMAHVARRDYKLPRALLWVLLSLLDLLARAAAGFSLKGADTRQALAHTQLPVLFLHGEKDDFVPVSMTEENYHACASPKALRLVPGAEHAQSFGVDTPGCEETIQRFLEGCLG